MYMVLLRVPTSDKGMCPALGKGSDGIDMKHCGKLITRGFLCICCIWLPIILI